MNGLVTSYKLFTLYEWISDVIRLNYLRYMSWLVTSEEGYSDVRRGGSWLYKIGLLTLNEWINDVRAGDWCHFNLCVIEEDISEISTDYID